MDSRKALNEIKENTFYNHGRFEMRISKECYGTITEVFRNALEKTSDKNCSKCRERGKCAIYDNFSIDYCSDWRGNE